MHADESNAQVRRSHGFERPYSGEQVATWVLFPLVIVQFFVLLMPQLRNEGDLFVALPIFFGVVAALACVGVYKTCSIDACDPNLLLNEHEASSHAARDEEQGCEDEDHYRHCYKCQRDVHKKSLHCMFCHKCVYQFDHHCKWLNTCVGHANYPYFLLTVFSITAMTSLSLALTVRSVVLSTDEANMNGVLLLNTYVPLDAQSVQTACGISLVVLVPLVIMVWQLAIFHSMLLVKGITTYEYIVGNSKRKQEKKKAKRLQQQQQEQLARNEKSRMRAIVQASKAQPIGSKNGAEEVNMSAVQHSSVQQSFDLLKGESEETMKPSDKDAEVDTQDIELVPVISAPEPNKNEPAEEGAVTHVNAAHLE